MAGTRTETDSLGAVEAPADKLWGAQTRRSLAHFSLGADLIPREMIRAYAILKKAAAIANHDGKRLADQPYRLIVQVCDEILAGQHHDMFPPEGRRPEDSCFPQWNLRRRCGSNATSSTWCGSTVRMTWSVLWTARLPAATIAEDDDPYLRGIPWL